MSTTITGSAVLSFCEQLSTHSLSLSHSEIFVLFLSFLSFSYSFSLIFNSVRGGAVPPIIVVFPYSRVALFLGDFVSTHPVQRQTPNFRERSPLEENRLFTLVALDIRAFEKEKGEKVNSGRFYLGSVGIIIGARGMSLKETRLQSSLRGRRDSPLMDFC